MAPLSFNQSWPFVACILCLVASLPHATIAQTNCGTSTCSGGDSCCNNQCCALPVGTSYSPYPPPQCCSGVCCADNPAQVCAYIFPPDINFPETTTVCCSKSRVFVQRFLPAIRYCCAQDLCLGNFCCIPGRTVCSIFGCMSVGTVVGDPHISLPGLLPANQTDVIDFTFDFHGSAGKAYCMITSAAIAVNAHMFSLAPTAVVPEHRYHGGRCFQFTWIDGIGFVYRNPQGRSQRIAVWLDRTLTDLDAHPFNVTFEDEPIETSQDAAWTSPDGIARIGRTAVPHLLVVSLDGLLEVEISRAEDAELRDQPGGPPVRYVNLAVKGLAVGPGVHGFMGQMYAPGAVEARLKMATQAGLNHREYVEGADEDYQTSDLTSADCSFDRFTTAVSKAPQIISASRKLRSSAPQKKESLACSYSGTSFTCK